MSVLHALLAGLCLVGAWFLVTGPWYAFPRLRTFDVPTIATCDTDGKTIDWASQKTDNKLSALPPQRGPSRGREPVEEDYVPPAWGIFAATVLLCLYVMGSCAGTWMDIGP